MNLKIVDAKIENVPVSQIKTLEIHIALEQKQGEYLEP